MVLICGCWLGNQKANVTTCQTRHSPLTSSLVNRYMHDPHYSQVKRALVHELLVLLHSVAIKVTIWLGFPTRVLPNPKTRVLAACKPGFSGLNFDLHCLIKRPYILTRNDTQSPSHVRYRPRTTTRQRPSTRSSPTTLLLSNIWNSQLTHHCPTRWLPTPHRSGEIPTGSRLEWKWRCSRQVANEAVVSNWYIGYRYFLSIPPSSVDAEREFTAGILCTKVRSRLGDNIDTLCFLRSYYQKNKAVDSNWYLT